MTINAAVETGMSDMPTFPGETDLSFKTTGFAPELHADARSLKIQQRNDRLAPDWQPKGNVQPEAVIGFDRRVGTATRHGGYST